MTPIQRALRTLLQLLVSGALTGVVDVFAHGLSPQVAALILAGWQVVVTYAHNWAEDAGVLPKLAKPDVTSETGAITVTELCLVVLAAVALAWAFGWAPK